MTTDTVTTNTVVAQVNGHALYDTEFETLLAADRAMAEMLQSSIPSTEDALERFVNGELVRQAAAAASFTPGLIDVEGEIARLLAARGKTTQDLSDALGSVALPHTDFAEYFRQLLLIDRFTRQQAEAQESTVDAYIQTLQDAARISYGPAAATVSELFATTEAANTKSTHVKSTEKAESEPEASSPPAERGTEVGADAPLFELPALNWDEDDILAFPDLLGTPTVLSFWTTWCPYCRRQTPVLVDAHARVLTDTVQFIGINVQEDAEQVTPYLETHGIRYPIALDVDGDIAAAYGVRGYPTTYFLDAQGRVVARHIGVLSAERLDGYIARLQPDTDTTTPAK